MMTYRCDLRLLDSGACGGSHTKAISKEVLQPNKFEEVDCVGWHSGRAESLAPDLSAGWIREQWNVESGEDACACHTRVVEA